MGIYLWMIIGALAGWAAKRMVPTLERGGLFIDVIVGMLGALIAGAFFYQFTGAGVDVPSWSALLVALIGASVLLMAYKSSGLRLN